MNSPCLLYPNLGCSQKKSGEIEALAIVSSILGRDVLAVSNIVSNSGLSGPRNNRSIEAKCLISSLSLS